MSAMRLLAGLLAVLFLYAVVVQFNDPDPVQWMLVYGAAAVLSALAAARRLAFWPPLVLAGVALAWAGAVLPPALAQDLSLAAEEPRELFGLLIVAGWSAGLAVWARVSRPAAASPSSSRRA